MSEPNALSELLGGVLQNPDAMNTLMKLASNLGAAAPLPDTAHRGQEKRQEERQEEWQEERREAQEERSAADRTMPREAHTDHAPFGSGDRERIALLNALRPYLGEERRKKADSVLGLLRMLRAAEESGLLRGDSPLGGLFPQRSR